MARFCCDYYVDYEWYDEAPPEDVGFFHATWNHENPTSALEHPSDLVDPVPWDLPGINLTGEENCVILDAVGTGHYVGCVLNIDNFSASSQVFTWPGEGDDMFFIDGESWPPSLHGTGTMAPKTILARLGVSRVESMPVLIKVYLRAAMFRSISANGACTAGISKTRFTSPSRCDSR